MPLEEAPMGTTGLETAFAAVHTELVVPGVLPLALVVEKLSAGAALFGLSLPRIAVGAPGRPVPDRPRGGVGGRRGRLREPLGELLLRRAHAARQGARDGRRRRRRLPGAGVRPERRVSSAYVLLEDGARFDGDAVGAPGPVTGEVVFTTGMSGYQESMSDPSFARQLITFTYPHIGNYGVSARRRWSPTASTPARRSCARRSTRRRPGAERAGSTGSRDSGIPGIDGVDTRALVRHIRDAGAMRGGVFPGEMRRGRGARADRRRAEHGRPRPRARGDDRRAARRSRARGDGPRIAALDTGIKHSIVRNFTSRGATLELYPCTTVRRRAARARRRRHLPRPGPRRPGGARLHRRHDPRADRAQAGVRHLPRPPAALARGRAGDVQAPVRPPRRQPPGQGPARPTASRSPRRTTASRSAASPARGCSPTSARPSSRT